MSSRAVVVWCLIPCLAFAAAPPPNRCLRKPEKYSLYGGVLKIDLTEDGKMNRFSIERMRAGGRAGGGFRGHFRYQKEEGAFVYPLSDHQVWYYRKDYEGTDELYLLSYETDGSLVITGTNVNTAKNWHAMLKTVPQAVINELPARIRAFQHDPEPDPPRKKPSR